MVNTPKNFAVYVQTFVKLVPLNVKHTLSMVWSIAESGAKNSIAFVFH